MSKEENIQVSNFLPTELKKLYAIFNSDNEFESIVSGDNHVQRTQALKEQVIHFLKVLSRVLVYQKPGEELLLQLTDKIIEYEERQLNMSPKQMGELRAGISMLAYKIVNYDFPELTNDWNNYSRQEMEAEANIEQMKMNKEIAESKAYSKMYEFYINNGKSSNVASNIANKTYKSDEIYEAAYQNLVNAKKEFVEVKSKRKVAESLFYRYRDQVKESHQVGFTMSTKGME